MPRYEFRLEESSATIDQKISYELTIGRLGLEISLAFKRRGYPTINLVRDTFVTNSPISREDIEYIRSQVSFPITIEVF